MLDALTDDWCNDETDEPLIADHRNFFKVDWTRDGAKVERLVGYEMNFLKPAQKTIADHGGKYLAGGFNKTLSLAGTEPPNRVVLLQFANVKAWRKEGAADLENDVGEKYAKFRVYAVEGIGR
jgi:uncharacterized protein (DUF1330 family)